MKTALHRINLDEIGGVERLFDNFVSNSSAARHHIVLNQPVHTFLSQVAGASVHNIKWKNGRKIPRPFRKARVKRIFKSIDPEVCLYWDTEERHLDILKRQRKKAPVLFYDHGYSWLSNKEKRFSEFLRHVDMCIACSHASKRMLELRWNVSAPIEVIKNPLRPDILPATIEPRRAPQGAVRIGCVGRLVPAKGHCIALHVLAGLKKAGVDAELHIAGGGTYLSELKALSAKLGLEKEVFFLGCIDDIASFYRSVDICLNPSISEAFGLISVEAQAFGCVPIVSYTDGLAETIVNGKTGIGIIPSLEHGHFPSLGGSMKGFPAFVYDPIEDRLHTPNVMDPQRVVEEVIGLLNDPERYERMSLAGANSVREAFSFQRYVDSVEALVASVVHRQERSSLQVAHVMEGSLDGGMQRLYSSYMRSEEKLPHRHNTIACIGRLSKEARAEARRGGLGLWETGSLFSPYREGRALEIISPQVTLHWNRTGVIKKRSANIYYDLGRSWEAKKSSHLREFLRRADMSIACSYASKRMLKERFQVEHPISVIHSALPSLRPDIQPKRRPSYRPFVMGAIAPAAPLAIHAAALLKDVCDIRLMIAGVSPKNKELNRLIRFRGMGGRVLLLGQVSDMEGFYGGIDCFFASLLYAPCPLVLIEALAHGCPVLAPAVDSVPEIVTHEKSGFCLDLNIDQPHAFGCAFPIPYIYDPEMDVITSPKTTHPGSVAEAAALLLDSDRLAAMSEYALHDVKDRFSFARYARQLTEALSEGATKGEFL